MSNTIKFSFEAESINLYITSNSTNNMSNNDGLFDLLLAGGLGFLAAKGQYSDWEPLIQNFKKRLEHLQYVKIKQPMGFLEPSQNMRTIYRESIMCHLFGLPNSVLPNLMRVLEQALRKKYEEKTGEKPPEEMGLKKLIDWAEKTYGEGMQIAHSFRMLRNYVHTDVLIKEQDTVEAIRHISDVTGFLFPTNYYEINTTCRSCGKVQVEPIQKSLDFLGNNLEIKCSYCSFRYNLILLP